MPTGGLSGLDADFGQFDAVVDGVADQVRERIADRFDDRLVEFDFLAFDRQLALFSQRIAQVAHDARELAEDGADRLQPRLHDRFLQFAGDLIDPRGDDAENVPIRGGDRLQQLIARQHQFARQIHQAVQHGDGDADVRFARRCRWTVPAAAGDAACGAPVFSAGLGVAGTSDCYGVGFRHFGFLWSREGRCLLVEPPGRTEADNSSGNCSASIILKLLLGFSFFRIRDFRMRFV